LDSAIGDGDHGIGMEKGFLKVKEKISAMNPSENVYDVFTATGRTLLMSMGGASGVMFGHFFAAGAKNAEPKTFLNPEDFIALMQKSLNTIKETGKANIGDKTMVDALEPAVQAMKMQGGTSSSICSEALNQLQKKVLRRQKHIAKYGQCNLSEWIVQVGFRIQVATSVVIMFRSLRELCW
jgi:dihydroxyacetone kinase